MPSSTFVNQDFFIKVLAVFSVTVAFTRWFPDADLVAPEAHFSSYVQTFKNSSESALILYAVHLVVDIIRVLTLAILVSTAFSFAFVDVLMLGVLHAFPESNDIAAAKVAELMRASVNVERVLIGYGAVCLAIGLYRWSNAIGRDKRQVISEAKKTN
ncbi:hypothetical protein BGX20_006870 [Mortierella sp. AD010]|nr:hypothetical protein BGX20_006870 [Mortierella sp. AD010]